MTNFKIGQKVVCVKVGNISQLKIGKVYTILDINTCRCGSISYYVGLDMSHLDSHHIDCSTCKLRIWSEKSFHTSDKFRPLIYNSATEEILQKFKLTEEKADVEIKELQTV